MSSLSSLFLALVLYPDVQKRAQAELDTVIARDRLPTFDDRPHLPYVDALCGELLRWHMVAPLGMALDHNSLFRDAEKTLPLGVPHASTEDDVYSGFFIPKGKFLILLCALRLNVWQKVPS